MPEDNIEIKILDNLPPKKGPNEEVIETGEADLTQPRKPDIVLTGKDLEPEIKIGQAEPPLVKISRRDLARNRPEWIGAAAQDLIGKGKQFIESKGWWGKGKTAERKRAAFEQVEQKRQSFEDLFEQIKILPGDLNERLSDIEVAALEIKIIDGELKSIPSEPEIQIDISEDQIQELQRVRQEAVESQRQQLHELYASNGEFNTPVLMERHLP